MEAWKMPLVGRRQMMRGGVALGAAAMSCPGVFAEMLATPAMTEGAVLSRQNAAGYRQ